LVTTKKHCIICECVWGSGEDIESSGICPSCFGEWANDKRKSQNQAKCYGEYHIHLGNDCDSCFVSNLCEKDS
jgi:hypothetical protein